MMHAVVGDDTEVDVFLFFLAEKLGRPVHELKEWPALEIMQWRGYYAARNAQMELASRAASRG